MHIDPFFALEVFIVAVVALAFVALAGIAVHDSVADRRARNQRVHLVAPPAQVFPEGTAPSDLIEFDFNLDPRRAR